MSFLPLTSEHFVWNFSMVVILLFPVLCLFFNSLTFLLNFNLLRDGAFSYQYCGLNSVYHCVFCVERPSIYSFFILSNRTSVFFRVIMCPAKNTYSPNSLVVRWLNESVLYMEMKAEGFWFSAYRHYTPFCFVLHTCTWTWRPLGSCKHLQGEDKNIQQVFSGHLLWCQALLYMLQKVSEKDRKSLEPRWHHQTLKQL